MLRTEAEWHWFRIERLSNLLNWSYGREPDNWRNGGVHPPYSEERERRERALRLLRNRSYDQWRVMLRQNGDYAGLW